LAPALRIATYNLENLDDRPDLEPPLAARVGALRPRLSRLDADVLCLQEVNAQKPAKDRPRRLDALDALLAGTPYAGFARLCSVQRNGVGPMDKHNLVILSRFPVLESGQLWHDLVPPPLARRVTADPPDAAPATVEWDRPVLWAMLDLGGGRRLTVLDVHLRAPLAAHVPGQKAGPFVWRSVRGWAEGFYLAAMKRTGQAFEARLFVDRLFDDDPDALIAVCGDFNATERETPLRALRGDPEDTGDPAHAARALMPLEFDIPEYRRFTVLHGGRPVMLDHLLVSPALLRAYAGAEVLNEGLGDELIAFKRHLVTAESFHAPVVARFGL